VVAGEVERRRRQWSGEREGTSEQEANRDGQDQHRRFYIEVLSRTIRSGTVILQETRWGAGEVEWEWARGDEAERPRQVGARATGATPWEVCKGNQARLGRRGWAKEENEECYGTSSSQQLVVERQLNGER
jgi:hypothetical protein